MKRSIIQISIILCFLISLSALGAKYERKSISFVNALWLSSPEARKINQKQVNYILESIQKQIDMPRFDFNPLPEVLVRNFVTEANKIEHLSIDEIAGLMEEKLVPEITSILEEFMRERGGELVSDAKKQSFMATKAKELGITLEEIEKVMNSAYLYLPVLSGIEKEKLEKKDKFSYEIKGGIIWFQIKTDGKKPIVSLRVASKTTSQGWGSDSFAFESAVDNFARNLEVATRDIQEFKLSSSIAEVSGRRITFNLGRKEGLGMDNTLLVGEMVMDASGDAEFEQSGWVKVDKIGNNIENKLNYSSAWAVKKGNWARGMAVIEHPRLGIDVAFKPMLYSMKVSEGYIPLAFGELEIIEDYTDPAFGMDLDFHINIAGIFNSPQFFLILGGNIAVLPGLEFKLNNWFSELTTNQPYIWGFHGGLMKKIYLGRIALSAAVKGGMKFFNVEQKIGDHTLTMENNSGGAQFDLGLDFAATPDVNVGIMAGFRAFTVSDSWSFSLDTDDPAPIVDDFFPKVDHSGMAYGLYLHYTPPSLPFDPGSFFKAFVLDQ
ncbi:hypothetical protein H8D57_02720 [bacterium]|nr:hypothetical protein [bacterium]